MKQPMKTNCNMRWVVRAMALAIGCGAESVQHGDASERPEPRIEASSEGAFVVDGLIVWPEPIERAPELVRDSWAYNGAIMTAIERSPRPPDGRGWRGAWYEDVCEPYWERVRLSLDPQLQRLVHERERAFSEIPSFDLFETASNLVIQARFIRHMEELGVEPWIGSCDGGPEEELGNLLTTCRDRAERCIERMSGEPWQANRAVCERLLAEYREKLARAQEGVCEAPEPKR